MSVSEELVKRYKHNTLWLCLWLKELQNYADKKACGEEFDKDKFIYACKMCEKWKKALLESKEVLGYTDRFQFMEDNNFLGFSIKNGRFVGDVSDEEIFSIVDKWFYGFPDTANHYQFEVSVYVLTLSDVDDRTDVLYKDFNKNT